MRLGRGNRYSPAEKGTAHTVSMVRYPLKGITWIDSSPVLARNPARLQIGGRYGVHAGCPTVPFLVCMTCPSPVLVRNPARLQRGCRYDASWMPIYFYFGTQGAYLPHGCPQLSPVSMRPVDLHLQI